MYKIENAIILAAGLGSRLKDLTSTTPKCMLKINNQTIIQRTIEVLKYKYINNIVVVTGFKSNVLENHLRKEKIKFIFNPVYKQTNSIMSMCLAKKYLANSIVLDSDIYIKNPDIIKNEIEYSGYTSINTNAEKEWQLIVDKDNFISDVKTSGSYESGQPILDISYWTEDDANKIKILLREEQDMNKFWDEVPLLDNLKQFKLKRYDIEEGDAMEFDTKEELEEIRRKVCLVD